jgi:outer membrane receptor protein involved in Fe transport
MLRGRSIFLAAVGLAGGSPALAEEPPQIVVTGQGLAETPATPAYGVVEIDRDRLTSTGSGRIEDALSQVAGFQQFRRSDSRSSNPSAQGVTLRALGGNATSRTLVVLDGVPLADPFFGYIPLSAIDPGQLARVRVTRGGGSGAFGAGAVAGTIELESADAARLGLIGGGLLVNDRGETELSGSVAPRLGEGYVVASGRWDRGQGFWTTPGGQRRPASVRARFDSWTLGLRGAAPVADDIELQFRLAAFDDDRTLRFRGADSFSSGQDGSLRLVGRGRWQFDLLGYVQARDFGNVVVSSTSFRPTLDQRKTPSTGIGGKFVLRPPVGEGHVLRLGTDIRIADGELQEEPISAATGLATARRRAGGRNSDLGVYAEDDWTLGRLVLTGGVRADRWTVRSGFFRETTPGGTVTVDNRFADRSGWQASYRGGAVYQVNSSLALRAAAYSSLRQPTLNELYRPFVVFPVTTRANAALRNEVLHGVEAGLDFVPAPGWMLSFTAFDNRIDNAIANVTIAANLRERRNVDAVRSRGVEAAMQARIGGFGFTGSLSLNHAEVRAASAPALDGRRPAQTPHLAGSATLDWRPREGWVGAVTLRHVSSQAEDDLGIDSLPAATTVDAYFEVPAGSLALVMRAENLLGERVVTRNQGGSIDTGSPRTVWGGVKVRF